MRDRHYSRELPKPILVCGRARLVGCIERTISNRKRKPKLVVVSKSSDSEITTSLCAWVRRAKDPTGLCGLRDPADQALGLTDIGE
jgi:hypothetical protein